MAACDRAIVSINGGTKPYTVTVIDIYSTVIRYNYTLGSDDNAFSYVNEIPPGDLFFSTYLSNSDISDYSIVYMCFV